MGFIFFISLEIILRQSFRCGKSSIILNQQFSLQKCRFKQGVAIDSNTAFERIGVDITRMSIFWYAKCQYMYSHLICIKTFVNSIRINFIQKHDEKCRNQNKIIINHNINYYLNRYHLKWQMPVDNRLLSDWFE